MNDNIVGLVGIGKSYVTEFHLARYGFKLRALCALILQLFLIQEFEHALRRGRGRLDVRHGLAYLLHGALELAYIYHEGRYNAECYDTVHSKQSAHDTDSNVAEIAYKAHERHHQPSEELRVEVRLAHRAVLLIKFCFYLTVRVRSPDYVMSGIHLFDIAVQVAQVLLSGDEIFLRFSYYHKHEYQGEDRREHRRAGHDPVRDQHHHKAAGELCHRSDHGRQ